MLMRLPRATWVVPISTGDKCIFYSSSALLRFYDGCFSGVKRYINQIIFANF